MAALYTVAKTRKQSICPSTNEGMKKIQRQVSWNIIQPSKDEEILPFAQTQMDLKDIMLS